LKSRRLRIFDFALGFASGRYITHQREAAMSRPHIVPLESRTHLNAGQLDPFFGTDGVAAVEFPGGGAAIVDVAPQADGSVYVAAKVTPTGGISRFGLARFRSNGTLDTSFGTNGWATVRIGTVDNIVADMAVQPDGRIVLVGTSVNPPQDPPHFFETIDITEVPIQDERNFVVLRFRTDGSLDPNFGRRGKKIIDVGRVGPLSDPVDVESFASDEAQGVVIQQNGKIIVAGLGAEVDLVDPDFIVETPRFSLVRLNSDGSIDRTYGPDGTGMNLLGGDDLNGMGLDSQGRLLVVGSNRFTNIEGEERTSRSVRRLRTRGKLDPDYHGLQEFNQGVFTDGAVQSDGKALARGFDELLRFKTDGSADNTFNANAGDDGDPDTDNGAFATDQGGKIIFLTSKPGGILPATPTFFPVLRRILSNGTPDSGFGPDGVVENSSAPSFDARRIAVNPDGSYIGVGGDSSGQAVLARFFRDDGPVALLKVQGITSPKSTAHPLTITYRDDDAIDLTTLDDRDVRVTGPNGFVRYARFSAILNNADPRQVTVRYKLTAPGSVWDATDSGVYTVRLRTDQVADEDGNFASTPTLGSFRVSIPIVGVVPAKLVAPPRDTPLPTRMLDLINAESQSL
jgi:uncharacterized delta-60 repeat protein